MVKNPPANAGDLSDVGSTPGLGTSPGVDNGNSLQYSCLENSMERGVWWATVHGAAKNWTPHTHRCVPSFDIFSNLLIHLETA